MENAWLARVAKLPSPRHAALPHQAADDSPTITQPRVEGQITPRADKDMLADLKGHADLVRASFHRQLRLQGAAPGATGRCPFLTAWPS